MPGLFFLNDQAQPLDFPAVLRAGGHNVDAGGVDAVICPLSALPEPLHEKSHSLFFQKKRDFQVSSKVPCDILSIFCYRAVRFSCFFRRLCRYIGFGCFCRFNRYLGFGCRLCRYFGHWCLCRLCRDTWCDTRCLTWCRCCRWFSTHLRL